MENRENGEDIAHASHYGPLQTKKGTCLKRLSARLWQPAAALFPIVKEKPSRSYRKKQQKKNPTNTDTICINAGTQTKDIPSCCA
jgi:hypothetical protein